MPAAIHRARARLIERRELKARRVTSIRPDPSVREDSRRVIWNVIDLSRPVERLGEAEATITIASGDHQSLLQVLVAKAAQWFDLAGSHIEFRHAMSAADCVGHHSARHGALLAAAVELCALLELSPQGREAVADFGRQPVFQEREGE